MQLKITKGDITAIECDAIVSSTCTDLIPSGNIDAAIHKVAGPNLTDACAKIAHCDVGMCVITDGYNLPATYVIHTVAPYVYDDSSAHLLAQCYKNAINRAMQKGCKSIAFPLIGSGNRGFSVKKALDVAINRFEVCVREKKDILIYLVLMDEETKLSAIARAKVIGEKYLITDDEIENAEDSSIDKRWISLCKVNRPDKNKDIWMQRLADAVGGVLVAPLFDDNKEKIFDNRPLIFCEDGPNDPDVIGFWEWTERKGDSGRWLSDASYIENVTPVEIVVLDYLASIEDLSEALKAGIKIPSYICGQVLVAIKNKGCIEGILCDLNNFDIRQGEDMFVTLKNDIYTLPYYSLSEDDVFVWRYRKIYKYISLKEPQKRILIHGIAETIKEIFLQRMNWPIFKAQGITKSDWQKFKRFFVAIPPESICERLAEMYSMSGKEAQDCVNSFLQTVDNYVEVEDIDSTFIVQMIDNHNGLKQACDEIAYKKWCAEHKTETDKAEAEIAVIRDKAKQEQDESEQRLSDIKEAISAAEQTRSNVLSDISAAHEKLGQLQEEIVRYENLGKDALVAVQQKIADAQKDMAGFIADLSVVLPQPAKAPTQGKRVSLWQYDGAISNLYDDDEIELAKSWEDEFNALSQSLAYALGVESELCTMLAAFLYAIHIHNAPILIVGPCGHDIANALSVSLYADGAGQLTLGNEFDLDIVKGINDYNESVFSVENMFGKGWSDSIPQSFMKIKKQVVWTHPYVEDMVIEPKGLYNYMIPILSECFAGAIPALEPWPGKRADNFQAYGSKKKQPLRLAAFKRLGLSKMLLNRLELILSDAKAILDNPAKEKDLEFLLGLLPICVLTGKASILKEVIETEGGISSAVKAEAERYIEEE